jgi:hypothetical protein
VRRGGGSSAPTNPRELIRPGGKPLGIPGQSSGVRELTGGKEDAERIFESLTKGGKDVTQSNHVGRVVELPEGGHIGYRPFSRSGEPTIDVNLPGESIREIKFVSPG